MAVSYKKLWKLLIDKDGLGITLGELFAMLEFDALDQEIRWFKAHVF